VAEMMLLHNVWNPTSNKKKRKSTC
jgi:hypothetical protein